MFDIVVKFKSKIFKNKRSSIITVCAVVLLILVFLLWFESLRKYEITGEFTLNPDYCKSNDLFSQEAESQDEILSDTYVKENVAVNVYLVKQNGLFLPDKYFAEISVDGNIKTTSMRCISKEYFTSSSLSTAFWVINKKIFLMTISNSITVITSVKWDMSDYLFGFSPIKDGAEASLTIIYYKPDNSDYAVGYSDYKSVQYTGIIHVKKS
ncbi:MAG: hypothetical protein FWD71_22305 [Oscillospiraceae bacterium]|nr:hypothetical protein [Oscillospiraceae bacterium]